MIPNAHTTAPREIGSGQGVRGLVSVVIPTYNRSYSLGPCIESVLAQTYQAIEILVVDDGSTDDTPEVVACYGARVRYLRQPNAGPAGARNLGFRHARGEFIALNDSDDRWNPWKVEAQVNALRSFPDVGMVWTDCALVTDAGECVSPAAVRTQYNAWRSFQIERVCGRAARLQDLCAAPPPDLAQCPLYVGDFFSQMILGSLVITPSVMLRRKRLGATGGFDESLTKSGEDYEFHLRTCWHGPVAFLDAPSVRMRTGSGDQLTSPAYRVHLARNSLTALTRWLERGRERLHLPDTVVRRRLAGSYGWLGEEELRCGDRLAARRHLWQSLRLAPRQRRRLILFLFTLLPSTAFPAARSARAAVRRWWRSSVPSVPA